MDERDTSANERISLRLTVVLQVVLAIGVIGFVILHDWANALLTAAVIALSAAPRLLGKRLRIDVPPDFQLVGHRAVRIPGHVSRHGAAVLRPVLLVGHRVAH